MSKRKKKPLSSPKSTPKPLPQPVPERDQTRRLDIHLLALLALLAIVTTAAYWPAMHGGFIWDDDAHVTKPELRSFAGLSRIWFDVGATQQYYPLLHSAFWLEHKLWGDAALGYHMVNLALHIAAASLVYFVLRKLAVPGAWLAAAIFALHPVHVESVAWITEQKNTLSAVFYLSSMWFYLGFYETRRRSSYLLALGLFVLGLMTKTVTATLPAALLVIFWWQRGRLSWKRDVQPLIPFFVLGAAAGLFTTWIERNLIGAEGADFELTFVERCLLAGRAIVFYFAKLIWPVNLTFIYPRWNVDPTVFWQWLFPLVVAAATALLWAIHRRWRAPLAGWLFFVGTLFPVLGFLNVYPFIYSFVADHFQYLASLGIFALVAAAAALAIRQLPQLRRWVGNALCCVLLGVLAVLTLQQSGTYRDAVTLYAATIERNPECWMAYNNLGAEYAQQDNWQAAMECYERALQLRPKYAEAQFNLGAYYMHSNQIDRAIEHYRAAIEIRPGYADAHNSLGAALYGIGRSDEAIYHYKLVVSGEPGHANARNNLGIALLATGKVPEAVRQFEQAVRHRPDYAEAHNGLARALLTLGQQDAAINHYQKAVQFMPDYPSAHNGLGVALAKAGRLQEAVSHFEAVVGSKQTSVDDAMTAYKNLTGAYSQLNQMSNAIAAAERAVKLARSAGREDMASQIDAWLAQNRAPQPASGNASPVITAPHNVP